MPGALHYRCVPFVALTATALLTACGGGGGDGGGSAAAAIPPAPSPASNVAVRGVVTYERIPFGPQGTGLDYAGAAQMPSPGITIEAIDATTQAVLASGSTNAAGEFELTLPTPRQVRIRVRSEMTRAAPQPLPHWQFQVRDIDGANTLYGYTSPAFDTSAGVVQQVAIPSGWSVARQQTGSRDAAPFAILDTVYRAVQTVLAVDPNASFPPLGIDWSPTNVGGETFYTNDAAGSRMVLSGEADVDTDEYDAHVIAHEFGHYLEDRFSRSDNIGGPHTLGDRLDMRVAFGEGFGYAFSAIALGEPLTRDSFGPSQGNDGFFSVEQDFPIGEGWYSEASSQEILWDLYDSGADGVDGVSLGFAPLWQLLRSEQRDTGALTSIFSFVSSLKQQNPAQAALIDDVLNAEAMVGATIDAFGGTETNDAGNPNVLPVYGDITVGGAPVTVTSLHNFAGSDPAKAFNKLGVHRYLRLDVPAPQRVQITVTAAAGRDPDIAVYRRGSFVGGGEEHGSENFQIQLPTAGLYILDLYDCVNAGCAPGTPAATPMTVSVSAAPN